MEEQILRYYLKNFSFLLFIFFIIYFFYVIYIKSITLKDEIIIINNGENLEDIILENFSNSSYFNLLIYKNSIKLYNLFIHHIHFGEFKFNKKTNFIDFLIVISKPSNIIKKITIIEGWSNNKLNLELQKKFFNFETLLYKDIIADTYYIEGQESFIKFKKKLINFKKELFFKYRKNPLLLKYSIDEIMIIGSLIEKEGFDYDDKKKISSVIFNRLAKKMKLQIDATVIYSITKGDYEFQRKLTYNDLKINSPYNTYVIRGLPPRPISYVGRKTIELIMENYKTNYLYYFYDDFIKKHVFSEKYKQHLQKLNEYRNKK